MSDTGGCPACGSANVISANPDASGSWLCMGCNFRFDDFGAMPTVTDYAVKQDEPYHETPAAKWRSKAAWYSSYGS